MKKSFKKEVWKNKWSYLIALILFVVVSVNGGLNGAWDIFSFLGYLSGFFVMSFVIMTIRYSLIQKEKSNN